jgi:hypothetical protein
MVMGAAVLPPVARIAWALDYPIRPLRIIVGSPPGGGNDTVGRLIGQWLAEQLGQPVIVENRPGAGTNIGTALVAKAAPDGYTLLIVSTANATNASLYRDLDFNFLRDLAPIAGIGRGPRHGGEPARPGQDASRVYRVRQGSSQRHPDGLVGHRRRQSYRRRALQDDGRDRPPARSLSR